MIQGFFSVRRLAAASAMAFLIILFLFNSGSITFGTHTWDTISQDSVLQLQGAIHFFKSQPDALLPAGIADATSITPAELELEDPVQPSEWVALAKKTQKEYPLVIFSKTYCPYSKRAKSLLESYRISPKPLIIEADLRADTPQLTQLLKRLTGRATFPNVILQGHSIGGSDDIQELHLSGKLRKMLKKAGLKVEGDGPSPIQRE